MRSRVLQIGALTATTIGAMAFSRGGWAVVTVDDLPSTLTIGQPTKIAFTVRQHGHSPLDRLEPTLVATNGSRGAEVSASATPTGAPGHYAATLVVPRSGDWTVTINSGFGPSHVTLYPIPAAAAAAGPQRAEPQSEVGRRLFVAKGCVTCHVHDGVSGVTGNNSISVGPELTPKRYQADYLAKLLADPSIARTPGKDFKMPNLGLKTPEIAALVAFINLDRQAATR